MCLICDAKVDTVALVALSQQMLHTDLLGLISSDHATDVLERPPNFFPLAFESLSTSSTLTYGRRRDGLVLGPHVDDHEDRLGAVGPDQLVNFNIASP